MHNALLEKTSARIELNGLQSIKTGVAGEGQEEVGEKVPVKLCSDVKGEK